MVTYRWWLHAVVLALVLGYASTAASAGSSLEGPTGIVATPTAAVAGPGTLEAALTYQRLTEKRLVSDFVIVDPYQPPVEQVTEVSEDVNAWGAEVLGGIGGRAEYWAQYAALANSDDTHLWGAGGKVLLNRPATQGFGVAAGLGYWLWADGQRPTRTGPAFDIGYWNAYLVATKELGYGPTGANVRTFGSVGAMYLRADPDLGSAHEIVRPFVNLEAVGNAGTSLGLEYRWKDDELDRKAVMSAVVRHLFSPVVSAEVGVTNSDPFGLGLDDSNVFARVTYLFGYGRRGGY